MHQWALFICSLRSLPLIRQQPSPQVIVTNPYNVLENSLPKTTNLQIEELMNTTISNPILDQVDLQASQTLIQSMAINTDNNNLHILSPPI